MNLNLLLGLILGLGLPLCLLLSLLSCCCCCPRWCAQSFWCVNYIIFFIKKKTINKKLFSGVKFDKNFGKKKHLFVIYVEVDIIIKCQIQMK